MHFNSKLIKTLLVTIPYTLAEINEGCTGRNGICINTYTCIKYNGKSFTGKCPNDASNIRCCDNIPCQSNGKTGKCMFTSQCQGTTVSGLCPGNGDFKCCIEKDPEPSSTETDPEPTLTEIDPEQTSIEADPIPTLTETDPEQTSIETDPVPEIKPATCTAEGKSGICMNTNQCTGNRKSLSGYCPGPANIQCCIEKDPEAITCQAEGKSGLCMDTNQCTGNRKSLRGYCPGPANIQCCIEKDPEAITCQAEGKSGLCMDTNQCTGNRKSLRGYCPGPANIQCCIEKDPEPVTCALEGKTGICIDTNQCTGNRRSVRGYCPGAANIQCCIEKDPVSEFPEPELEPNPDPQPTECIPKGNIETILAMRSNFGESRKTDSIKYIAIHYTANNGDTAKANANYFQIHEVLASSHYFVDDDNIVQSVPDNFVAWSVGGKKYNNDGGRLYNIAYNSNTLNIELCDTKKDEEIKATSKTIENALCFVRQKMNEYNIDKDHVIRHYDVNGKECPAYWLDDDLWKEEIWNLI